MKLSPEKIDQIGIPVFGLSSILLLNLGYGWAPFIGLASQVFWFRTTFRNRQWGIVVNCFIYTAAWLLGCLRYLGVL